MQTTQVDQGSFSVEAMADRQLLDVGDGRQSSNDRQNSLARCSQRVHPPKQSVSGRNSALDDPIDAVAIQHPTSTPTTILWQSGPFSPLTLATEVEHINEMLDLDSWRYRLEQRRSERSG